MPPKKKQRTSSSSTKKTRSSTSQAAAAAAAAPVAAPVPPPAPTVTFSFKPTLNNISQWGLKPGDQIPGLEFLLDQDNCDLFQALVLKCGVSIESAKELMRQGIENPEELARLTPELLKDLFKQFQKTPSLFAPRGVSLNVLCQKKIALFRQWAYERNICDIVVDLKIFDDVEMEEARTRKREIELMDDSNDQATKPPKLKRMSDWRDWHPQLLSYLSQKVGGYKISLSWIIRKIRKPSASDYDAFYESQTKRLEACAVFKGPEFTRDNKAVFDILKECTIGTEVWVHIQHLDPHEKSRTRSHLLSNGREAYLILSEQALQSNALDNTARDAWNTVNTTYYSADSKHFTFEHYVNKFVGSYADLKLCGEEPVERQKRELFLNKITCPVLNVQKEMCLGDPGLTFDECQKQLLSVYKSNGSRKSRLVFPNV